MTGSSKKGWGTGGQEGVDWRPRGIHPPPEVGHSCTCTCTCTTRWAQEDGQTVPSELSEAKGKNKPMKQDSFPVKRGPGDRKSRCAGCPAGAEGGPGSPAVVPLPPRRLPPPVVLHGARREELPLPPPAPLLPGLPCMGPSTGDRTPPWWEGGPFSEVPGPPQQG